MNASSTFDLAVIGAGPAGSATAITAARLGAKVVLVEAGQFPRHKVCGEYVSAESLHILHDLLRDTPEAERVLAAAAAFEPLSIRRESASRATISTVFYGVRRKEQEYALSTTARWALSKAKAPFTLQPNIPL
jgi:flavin-dependent dehydrogenase